MILRAPVAVAAMSLGIGACGGSPTADVCPKMPAAASKTILRSQCGPTLDLTPINKYQGDLVSVQDREDAVALVNGDCTGTLIAAGAGPVVLTAGHCVGLGDRELIAFNVEADPDGDPLVTDGTVFEQAAEPDYALIRLDKLPAITPTSLTTTPSDRLAIIQHPRGGPKVVAEGDFLGECNDDLIAYTNLDTLVGSSGAGVLTREGRLLGVHTDGDCTQDGNGANRGWTTTRIVAVSAYLLDTDIVDR